MWEPLRDLYTKEDYELWIEKLPHYRGPEEFEPAHEGDAGVDLYSAIGKVLKPGETFLMPCGIKIKLPKGTEGQLRTKSGRAMKQGLIVLNSPGTVDEGYRGEMFALLHNTSDVVQQVGASEKVAQLVITKYERPPVRYRSVSEAVSSRGADGFGSTGLKANYDAVEIADSLRSVIKDWAQDSEGPE